MASNSPTSSTAELRPSGRTSPLPTSDRIEGVDFARGIALLGILLVNMRFFFWPFSEALSPTPTIEGIDRSGLDVAAWALVESLCTFKFISLFSILFGFGVAVQVARATSSGASKWRIGVRRMGFLACIGFVHALLVWYGDILVVYSVAGVILLAISSWSVGALRRAFLIIAIAMTSLTLLVSVATALFASAFPEPAAEVAPAVTAESATEAAATTPPDATAIAEPNAPLRGLDAIMASGEQLFGSPVWVTGETLAYRDGPLLDAICFRAASWAIASLSGIFGWGWSVLMMMAFGMFAMRSGLFQRDPDAAARRARIITIGLCIGLPSAAISVGGTLILESDSVIAAAMHTLFLQLSAIALPPAYACLAVEWAPRFARSLARPIESAGRMALTIYLCESLACTAAAYWWGLGFFGRLSEALLFATACIVWGILVVFAHFWLARFSMGPMERLWRAVTYA